MGSPKGSQAEKQAARLGDLRGEAHLAFCPFETTSVYSHDWMHKPGSWGCCGWGHTGGEGREATSSPRANLGVQVFSVIILSLLKVYLFGAVLGPR